MELCRICDPFELLSVKDKVYPLFEKYYEKAKKYLKNLETPDVAWQNCTANAIYPDYYLYLIRENDEFIGYYVGHILRFPRFTVLYTIDYYIPNRGMEFWELMKQVKQILGFEDIWGVVTDKIFNAYKRSLKDATVEKIQMVRIKL